MERYPRVVRVKKGTSVTIRPLTKDDGSALFAFFSTLPDDDRLFLKEDVANREVIDRWIADLDYERVLPLIAEKNSLIVGDATLHFNKFGWSRHTAEIRCVVAKAYQKRGLGTLLMRELLSHAERKGVGKICAEVMDTQKSAQAAFERLGFKKAAELKDFVTDLTGETHNLVVMVNDVSELWKKMEELLLEYDVRPERWS